MNHNDVFYMIETMGNAQRINRLKAAQFCLKNPDIFPFLLSFAFNIKYKNHHKAAWILEFVLEKKLDWLYPHLEFFTENLTIIKDQSTMRPMAKICKWLAVRYLKSKDLILLNIMDKSKIQKIVEIGFDWMINEVNIATKVYTMDTLYLFGLLQNCQMEWVHETLKGVILQQMNEGSPGYKSHGKRVLEMI